MKENCYRVICSKTYSLPSQLSIRLYIYFNTTYFNNFLFTPGLYPSVSHLYTFSMTHTTSLNRIPAMLCHKLFNYKLDHFYSKPYKLFCKHLYK